MLTSKNPIGFILVGKQDAHKKLFKIDLVHFLHVGKLIKMITPDLVVCLVVISQFADTWGKRLMIELNKSFPFLLALCHAYMDVAVVLMD